MFYHKLIFLFVSMIVFSGFAQLVEAGLSQESKVVQIESIDQLPTSDYNQTIYLFNISDTLIDSPNMIGAKAWRKYIKEATKCDQSRNWHDLFSFFLLSHHYPVETVEGKTSQFIKDLQSKGALVCGLTGRERKMWYGTPAENVDEITIAQLKSVGIELSDDSLRRSFPSLASSSTYFKGVFFSDEESKSEYIKKLLSKPGNSIKNIVVVDDKVEEVNAISKVLSELKMPNECYWYSVTERKSREFNPLIANIQLYYFWLSGGEKVISDDEVLSIIEEYPERDAAYYLDVVMQVAKTPIK